ncbi:Lysophospholipase [Mycena chlorophos]|uniref:Lysophospholipase n=1 Tax=Mycena chlorophos TaxID=658473 RepID=A0A8H6S346_MYCCL|nr:Lysophospholipase [Mycena chlorophos]
MPAAAPAAGLRLVVLLALALQVATTLGAAAVGPTIERCPHGFELVRRGQAISASERQYMEQRREKKLPGAFKTYLENVKSTGHALPAYVEDIMQAKEACGLPSVGIATSGGGFRAAIFGAGVLNALDGRNSSSVRKGTGGLLQTATHLAGLSGGSWLVTSLVQANFPTFQHLVFGDGQDFGGWLPEYSLWTPTNDTAQQSEYAQELLVEIALKAKHFPVSVGDVWGRALARHFTNGTTLANFFDDNGHGESILFSELMTRVPTLASYEQPLPMMVVNLDSSNIINGTYAAEAEVPLNAPIFEINLFEFGSYDGVLAAHIPLKYLGTTNNSVCVTGFDEAMFLSGTSSNLWNELNITGDPAYLIESTSNFSLLVNETYPQSPNLRLDTSNYPNPFFGVSPKTFVDADETILSLCDGGEDGEITPYQPMLVKDRNIDVIIGIDANNDGEDYADGTSLIATQQRFQLPGYQNGFLHFPVVPTTPEGFISANLTSKPTFFGCDSATASDPHSGPPGPLLVYIANGAPPRDGSPPLTNTSTFQGTYTAEEVQGMLDQTFVVATQGAALGPNLEDPEWPHGTRPMLTSTTITLGIRMPLLKVPGCELQQLQHGFEGRRSLPSPTMRPMPISRRVQILAAIGGVALIMLALGHANSHSSLSPARWLPGSARYDDGSPTLGFAEGVAHMMGWESAGEVVPEAVYKAAPNGKKPLLLKGPPTTSYKDNLLPDVKYITSWHGDGISNDIMAYMTLLFLAKMTERVAIMDSFFPNPQHVGAGYDEEHQPKNLDFSEAFDIPRFTKLTGVDVVQWSQVKNASTDDLDTLGCWDLESLNRWGPHIGQTIDQLRIDISYTPAPNWAKLNPGAEGDPWSRISVLIALAFPEIYKLAMASQQPAKSRHLGVELPPDQHLVCFDFLFSTVETMGNDLFHDYSSVWRLIGQHLHFHPKVERLAQEQLRKMFHLSETEPIPPFISVHVRHNDFQIWCGDQSLEDCFAPFSQYAYRIKRMQKLLLATKGLSVNHVVVTSDENSKEFWAQVASYGYKSPDHSTTKEDHGPFYPFLIDGAILAMGSAIVGTDRSTLSGIAGKRVESWQGGPSYYVRWGGPGVDRDDHPDWGCCKTPGCECEGI